MIDVSKWGKELPNELGQTLVLLMMLWDSTTEFVFPIWLSWENNILVKTYSSFDIVYYRGIIMYQDLKKSFWWSDMTSFITECLVCQQVKVEHQRLSGLL